MSWGADEDIFLSDVLSISRGTGCLGGDHRSSQSSVGESCFTGRRHCGVCHVCMTVFWWWLRSSRATFASRCRDVIYLEGSAGSRGPTNSVPVLQRGQWVPSGVHSRASVNSKQQSSPQILWCQKNASKRKQSTIVLILQNKSLFSRSNSIQCQSHRKMQR